MAQHNGLSGTVPPMDTAITIGSSKNSLIIDRPHYDLEQLNNDLDYNKPKRNVIKNFVKNSVSCDPKEIFLCTFPFIRILSEYSWKNDLIGDIISGCTVAVMHIPQGIGYALLANLPPVVGLYSAFFPVLVYFFFGTSRHNSIGPFAILAIMTGKAVFKYSNIDEYGNIDETSDKLSAIQVACALAFITGAFQLLLYIFRLGIVTCLFSETLVSAFTTGTAVHVLTSQIKDVFGLNLPSFSGTFEVPNIIYEILRTIGDSNVTAIIISAITMTVLILNNEVLKQQLAKKTKIPFPMELMAIVIGTLVSNWMDLNEKYSVKIVNHIPTGFPAPTFPDLSYITEMLIDGFIMAIVGYSVVVSLAIILAQKFNYEIDYNQELLALGAANVVGSLFSCFPIANSMSRSAIQTSVGGKTQNASIVSCGILVLVLLWIGPFFEPLPRCVLASVIIVALKGMLFQVKDFPTFMKYSKLDAVVWMGTFLAVVIFAIDIGLAVGIILSLSCIFIRSMKPYTCILGNVPNTDLYLDINRYKGTVEIPKIKIFHFSGNINFASRTFFKSQLCDALNVNLTAELKKQEQAKKRDEKYEFNDFETVIIDMSALSYIDPSAITTFNIIVREFNKIAVPIYLAGCSSPIYELMKKCGSFSADNDKFKLFPTVHDAVHYSQLMRQELNNVYTARL